MCCCGLNTISPLSVSTSVSGDGAALDVSGLVAEKTIELNGVYQGSYTIMGSHDGVTYFPVLTFDSGAGAQNVKQTVTAVLKFMRVKRNATGAAAVASVAARAAVNCTQTGSAGANQFVVFTTLTPGTNGPQATVDLWSLVPATGLDDFNVGCSGDFVGTIAFEGSLNGINFAPAGQDAKGVSQGGFTAGQRTNTVTPTPTFQPLLVGEILRYVRLNVAPGTLINGPVKISIGGKQNCDCV